ncbi:hypothetical protein FSP39_008512 [Pinctada imbricata]|uniref:CCHC-type domain-containing protein n=1 Tax=Pinctada imbricata TaxID=66713 RepID=A0AA88XU89_PINIB|nr:hypothetical protein FSP39_008512 [Pinctada imbricata]
MAAERDETYNKQVGRSSKMAAAIRLPPSYADTVQSHKSEIIDSVKPVFILESDLFGEVKPSKDQFLTHTELYKAINSVVPASHLKGLQRREATDRWHVNELPNGDHILMCDPVSKPLPRSLVIGKYRATILHKDQTGGAKNITCNKCFQQGHKISECENDWVCKQCNGVGHKQSECTARFSDDPDSDLTVDESENDNESDTDQEIVSQSILQAPVSTSEPNTHDESQGRQPSTQTSQEQSQSKVNNKKSKEKKKKQANLVSYMKDPAASGVTEHTPRARNDKRNATTPTEELRSRSAPTRKQKS